MATIRPTDWAILQKSELFRDIDPRALDRLAARAIVQTLPPGTVLFAQGERPDFLHLALSGRIGLIGHAEDDQESIVEFFATGDLFIAPAVILDLPYLLSARLLEESRILAIPAEEFRRLMREDHGLALAVAQELSRHWRLLVRQIKDLKLRRAPQRLGAYLLTLSGGKTGPIALPEERRLIAQRLGMTPESLSRAFATLRDHGLDGRGQEVAIIDPAQLQAFCLYDETT